MNILSNSVKFTKNGFVKIHAKYCIINKEIIVSIEDSGIGIKPEDKELLFDDNDEKKLELDYENNKMGSGIGLKISYNIAKRLNHALEFFSENYSGTIFKLKINKDNFNYKGNEFKKEQINDSILKNKSKKIEFNENNILNITNDNIKFKRNVDCLFSNMK